MLVVPSVLVGTKMESRLVTRSVKHRSTVEPFHLTHVTLYKGIISGNLTVHLLELAYNSGADCISPCDHGVNTREGPFNFESIQFSDLKHLE